MITNLIPYLIHHEGECITSFFSPDDLTKNAGNILDVERGCVYGAYDEEFDFATEEDTMITAAIAHMMANNQNTEHQPLNEKRTYQLSQIPYKKDCLATMTFLSPLLALLELLMHQGTRTI